MIICQKQSTMAFALSSNLLVHCSNSPLSRKTTLFSKASAPKVSPTLLSHSRNSRLNIMIVRAASSAAGSSSSNNELNPFEVLGVNPIEGFEMVKAAYTRKRKDAERRGDEVTAARLDKAYEKVMMEQLTKRKKGMAFGSMQVSKDIKYADKQPILPWFPRYSKSDAKDLKINMAISAIAMAWIIIKQTADWLPVQCLTIAFVYRIFEKLKTSEPSASSTFTEEGEDEGRMFRMGKRLFRSLVLVFGCLFFVAVSYSGMLDIVEFVFKSVPAFLLNQELIITIQAAYFLCLLASDYR